MPLSDRSTTAPALLEVRGLCRHFPVGGDILGRATKAVKAVDGVDFTILKG